MHVTTTNHVLFGIQNLKTRFLEFNYIFKMIPAPATGLSTWMLVWLEEHSKFEPWGVLIERNGDWVASAIFTRYRRFGLWHIGKPGGSCDQLSFGAVDDDATLMLAQVIYDTINGFGGPWELEVPNLPWPNQMVNQIISSWPYSKTNMQYTEPCLIFVTNAPLNNYLSSNTRSSVAKAYNRIKREGIQMTQEWIKDPEQILNLLPQIQNICRCRDYEKYGKSLMDDPAENRYWITFMEDNTNQGLINLFTIYLNGELAAFALCLRDNGFIRVLTNRVSPKWSTYSAGTIANAEVVRYAFENIHIRGVNWGAGLQRYKLSGDVTLIPLQTLCAWSSVTGRIFFILRRWFYSHFFQ